MAKKEDHNISKDYEKTVKQPKQAESIASQVMVGDPTEVKQKDSQNSVKLYKKISIVTGVILLLFIAGWAILNMLKVQFVLVHAVCDDEDVVTYNSASSYQQRGGSEEYTIDEEGLKNLTSDIVSRNSYQKDPTCQTIVLESALYAKDYKTAQNAYNALLDLNKNSKYVDSDMNAGSPLSTYELLIQEISPSSQSEMNQGPQGGE